MRVEFTSEKDSIWELELDIKQVIVDIEAKEGEVVDIEFHQRKAEFGSFNEDVFFAMIKYKIKKNKEKKQMKIKI